MKQFAVVVLQTILDNFTKHTKRLIVVEIVGTLLIVLFLMGII